MIALCLLRWIMSLSESFFPHSAGIGNNTQLLRNCEKWVLVSLTSATSFTKQQEGKRGIYELITIKQTGGYLLHSADSVLKHY